VTSLVGVPTQRPRKEVLLLYLMLPPVPMMVGIVVLGGSCIECGTLVRRCPLDVTSGLSVKSLAGRAPAAVAVGVVWHVVTRRTSTARVLEALDELLVIGTCGTLPIAYALNSMLHLE
jgi:hypothetical protein